MRPEVRFSSGFPDDDFAGDGDIPDVQGGQNIGEALKVALEGLGYRVEDPYEGDNGWELEIWRDRKRVWLQISVLGQDECYLVAKNMTSWLWPDAKLFRAFLLDLNRVMQADSRFSDIGWLPPRGIERGAPPAAAPFDD